LKRIITLTTDFGTKDGYVGTVKGAIFSLNPRAEIVDISHEIPPQNIVAGAFCLFNSCSFFPKGTIHLAVVDPGVGSRRKALLVQTQKYFFVGPDNGIFSLALRREKLQKIIHLINSKYFLYQISPTFHGRDIFAPVAAYLSLGIDPDEFGPQIKEIQNLPLPAVKKTKTNIAGQIIHIDNFGNLVSNVTAEGFAEYKNMKVRIKKSVIPRLSRTFAEVRKGDLVAYMGSSNFLEIGIREGNAHLGLKAKLGDRLELIL